MHGCLRAVLNQRKVWELVGTNPAQGVRLPPKKARKPPVVLAKQDIRGVIEALPEPTKSMVVGAPRIGEVTALRWGRIHSDRIEIVERFYEGEFDDTKTDAGRGASRLIPPEFCVVRWMQLGSAQSIAIRGSEFSLPMLSPSPRA